MFPKRYKNLTPIIVFFLVFALSLDYGIHHADPHHVGLMLSNAKDLSIGKLPYKEIFIQYGILTTIVHSIAYKIYSSPLSLFACTSVAYATGLILISRLFYQVSKKEMLANHLLIACFLFHPVAILPWSNYLSFPFFIYGILLITKIDNRKLQCVTLLMCGASFSLAILARESMLIVVMGILVGFMLLDKFYFKLSFRKCATKYFFICLGIFICLLPFFIYLKASNLYEFWKIYSIDLPKVYSEVVFTHVRKHAFFMQLLKTIVRGELLFDIRWILIDLIITLNLYLLILFLSRYRSISLENSIIKISFASLVVLVSMLHIPEIFRFATGGILGIVVLYHFFSLCNKGLAFSYLIIGALAGTLFSGSSGLDYLSYKQPPTEILKASNVQGFRGQIWTEDMERSYKSIEVDLRKINAYNCGIKYHFNATENNFLAVISPFQYYQLAPFHVENAFHSSEKFDQLRPDLNYNVKIKEAKDIIIFEYLNSSTLYSAKYSGFYLFSQYQLGKKTIGIFMPNTCKVFK